MALNVPGATAAGGGAAGGGSPESSIAQMEAAFNRAIELSAQVTQITTEKKAQLDATKQRPQN